MTFKMSSTEKTKKKINLKPIFKFFAPLVRETLQTLPVIGTLVTNLKANTLDSPSGTHPKPKGWDIYRMIIGLGIGYVLVKGLATVPQIIAIVKVISEVMTLFWGGA